jgi:hypothetical protein
VTEEQGSQALISTATGALVLIVIAAAWTWGLRRLGARWAPRAVPLFAFAVFGVVELMVWLGPRPDVGPTVLLWAGLAMPVLVAASFTLFLLVALTLAVAVAGLLRQARGRAPS